MGSIVTLSTTVEMRIGGAFVVQEIITSTRILSLQGKLEACLAQRAARWVEHWSYCMSGVPYVLCAFFEPHPMYQSHRNQHQVHDAKTQVLPWVIQHSPNQAKHALNN